MSQLNKLRRLGIALLGVVAIGATGAGCKSAQRTTADQPTRVATASGIVVDSAPAVQAAPAAAMPVRSDGMVRGTLAYPTGDPKTATILMDKAIPAEIVANRPYTYELKLTNNTRQKLDNVEVVETLPPGLSFAEGAEGATVSVRDGVARINVGSLEPGESRIVRIRATATQAGAVSTCASVTYSSALCLGMNVVSPQLKISQTLPAEILVCNTATMNVQVTNSGTGTARAARLTSTLPEGLETLDGKSAFEIPLGDIAAGVTRTVDVPLKLSRTGPLVAPIRVAAEDGLLAESSSTIVARKPVLVVEKAGVKQVFVGSPFTYEIKVTNTGDAPAADTVVTDTLPEGITVLEATEGGRQTGASVVWNLGVIEPGATRLLRLSVRSDRAGVARNTVSAQASCADTATTPTTETAVVGVPAILLEVVDDPDPVRIGTETTYTIVVTNQGSITQTNLRLTAALEEQQELVAAQGVTASKVEGRTVTFEPLAALEPKARATYTVRVRAVGSADVRFRATVVSDQITRPVNEEESTNLFQ